MDEIETRARKCLSEVSGHDCSEHPPAANLHITLGMDSFDHIELMMLAEEEFGIVISDDDAETIKTVGDLIALVRVLAAARRNENYG